MSEFDRVIGYEPIKAELIRICDIIKHPDKYERLGVSFPGGILLEGRPGVGKTLLADCFVKECGVNSYICRKNKSGDGFVDFIKQTFDDAKKNEPSIIVLDDLDKYANEDDEHTDAPEYVTVQSCIDEVKGSKVLVFATVNRISGIPDSLIRAGRFDKRIEVKAPVEDDAVKLVEYYLSQKKHLKDIDATEVARILCGNSCATLETIINDAAIRAGFDNRDEICMDDILKSCLRLLYDAPETIRGELSADNEETAYHEAAHAAIGEILEENSVTLVSIGGGIGTARGFTAYYRSPDYWSSFELMKVRVMALLAGRAEIELKYGKYDVGATSDIERACSVVDRMVSQYLITGFANMDDSVLYIGSQCDGVKERRRNAVAGELEKLYMEVKRLLCLNREFVENLAAELIDRKTLFHKDIQAIKARSNIKLK